MPILHARRGYVVDCSVEVGYGVFILNSSQDASFVLSLNDALQSAGYHVFYGDQDLIKWGGSRLGVLVLCEEFFTDSPDPIQELAVFVNSNMRLLPLFYKLTPTDLRDKHRIAKWKTRWKEWVDDGDILREWTDALALLSTLNGVELREQIEVEYIELVVEVISELCPGGLCQAPRIPLHRHNSDPGSDILSGSSFKCNSMQCKDIADYLRETASFRELNEQRIRVLKCDQAIMEFCSAIVEAKRFLQDCSVEADCWKNVSNSLTKLHTGEAYNVLLHNLIWSKAGLDVAILDSNKIDYNMEIRKRVEDCKSVLSRYRPASIQARLNTDRDKFYLSLKNLQIPDESQKKCLTFLMEKWKAYQLMQSDIEATKCDGGGRAQYLNAFKLDPHDISHEIGGQASYLGHGSYGHVLRMSWLGQIVAVKVFEGKSMQELFKNEASLHACLQHPYIVHMVGWFTDEKDGSCKLVMELAPTDLQKVIARQHFISRPAAIDIMLQISKGMEYLHNKRVIHRDLKPNNVLLEPSSVKEMAAKGYARVKLCDFGLAKVKELSAKDQSMYTTFKAGTSYYRAPEVLVDDAYEDAAKGKYTRKADVFSFAITCSEILAGKIGPPCYQTSTKKIRERMLKNVRPELPPDCPSHLAQLIKRCWDTDPNCRPTFRTVSNILTYIKFILMRCSDVQRVPYVSVVTQFDEEELKSCVSEDEAFSVSKFASFFRKVYRPVHRR